MVAARNDIVVEQGATLRVAAQVYLANGVDPDSGLTGWTGDMQIRATVDSAVVLGQAAVTIDIPTGVVTATIDATDTAVMDWNSGVYDLTITDGDTVEALLYGTARLRRRVTR